MITTKLLRRFELIAFDASTISRLGGHIDRVRLHFVNENYFFAAVDLLWEPVRGRLVVVWDLSNDAGIIKWRKSVFVIIRSKYFHRWSIFRPRKEGSGKPKKEPSAPPWFLTLAISLAQAHTLSPLSLPSILSHYLSHPLFNSSDRHSFFLSLSFLLSLSLSSCLSLSLFLSLSLSLFVSLFHILSVQKCLSICSCDCKAGYVSHLSISLGTFTNEILTFI